MSVVRSIQHKYLDILDQLRTRNSADVLYKTASIYPIFYLWLLMAQEGLEITKMETKRREEEERSLPWASSEILFEISFFLT